MENKELKILSIVYIILSIMSLVTSLLVHGGLSVLFMVACFVYLVAGVSNYDTPTAIN